MSQHLVVSVEKGRWNTTMKPMFTESPLSPRHCSWNVSYFSYLPVKLEALGVHLFSSVQSLSRVQLFATPWTAAHQTSLSITNSQSLLKLMSIESVMPSNHSSSVVPFSYRLQSFPASGSLQMSQFFASGEWSLRVSASASVFPMNIQDWFSLGWTGWMSLQSKGLSRVFSNTTVQKHQFFGTQPSSQSYSHIHTWPQE